MKNLWLRKTEEGETPVAKKNSFCMGMWGFSARYFPQGIFLTTLLQRCLKQCGKM